MKAFRNSKSGFTLIELMIVVVIIGILAAIAIPNFLKVQNKAKCKACIANLKQLLDATNKYMTDTSLDCANADLLITASSAGWDGPYLKAIPLNPFSSAATYGVNGNQADGSIEVDTTEEGIGGCCTI